MVRKSPSLHEHLTATLGELEPGLYLYSMLASLFTTSLPIDEVARLWDVYAFEGDTVLVRAAVACLLNKEMALLGSRTESGIKDILRGSGLGDKKQAEGPLDMEDHFMMSVREAGKE